ncbi:unnamed protein product [Orchesella dallaii]|uniref:Telomeric repeat-binding factor 2-interacting protein 1 n=1 Tax=Orchesella dallaii TaxID=48710 RepID=A0ABP1RQQ0_9HEXA
MSLSTTIPANGGRSGEGEGEGGGTQGNGAGADKNFPPRFVSEAAKSTFEYLKKVPFTFQLIPPEDSNMNVEKSELFKKIRLAGGTIHPGVDVEAYVPGVIRILNEDYYVEHEHEDIRVPLDTYSSAFVYRCILNKNRGLPLPHPWKYLIPKDASKFGFYDARKILREEMEWDNVGKLVFPPKDKRITAQQWLAMVRRHQAKLQMATAPPPPEDSPPSQNLKETENDRQQRNKDAAQPISSPASTFIATTTSSNGIQVPPAATPSTSKELSPSQLKIHVKVVKLGSSTSPPKNPSELRIELERAAPLKSNQSSSTQGLSVISASHQSDRTSRSFESSLGRAEARIRIRTASITTGSPKASTSRIVPPSPKKSKTDSASSSNATALTKGGKDAKSLRNKEKPPETETTSLTPSPKPHSSAAKLIGSVSASAPSSSASSSTSGNGRESSSPIKTRSHKCKVVAVSGPKSRRYRNGRDSKVNLKPKPKLKPYLDRLYSVEEGQRLLDLICHHNAYTYVHGLKFWKLVEGSKKFPDRTHQSLKNHFHKVVVRKLTSKKIRDSCTYKIDQENMKKLKRGLQNRTNKHHNMCPDFEI